MATLDDLDKKIILALEEDARISLKQLAQNLNIKTSTIYHRLHRIQELNILKGFTSILNPDFLNVEKNCLVVIGLKNLMIKTLDSMFVTSFAKYLEEQFPESLFISVGDDNSIYMLTAHASTEKFQDFVAKLKAIPYVNDVTVHEFQKLVKGQRLYTFSNLKDAKIKGNGNGSKKEELLEEEDEEDEDIADLNDDIDA
jgi:DNA-binding Lrp family transcriptional regulator